MKKYVFTLLSAFLYSATFAQQSDYCGTVMPDDMKTWLKNYKLQNPHIAHKQALDTTLYFIPIKAHIVGNDQGGGFYPVSSLLDAMCYLNEQFEQVGFYFYLYGNINYIKNSVLYDHTSNVGTIVSGHNVNGAVNIYFVNDPNGNCGYFTGWRDFIAIAKKCGGSQNSTVAHEIGHYFSLPHTFSGWENRDASEAPKASDERVNGSNCVTAGDHFCDTPADYLSDRWSCPYNKTKNDYLGTPYNVDGTLFMSYANDACQDKFSAEQIDAMRSYLTTDSRRTPLLNHPEPVRDVVGASENVFPATGSSGIPNTYVNLKWRKAEAATHYNVVVRYFNGASNIIDVVTSDTSLLLLNELNPNTYYRWRVRPFNAGHTCAGYTEYSTLLTSASSGMTPTVNVSNISCPGQADGAIDVTITGGSGPFTYTWSTGSNDPNMSGLLPGNYELTINSSVDSLVLNFDIVEPDPLEAEVVAYGNTTLGVEVSGGTPPYTFDWSNGANGEFAHVSGAGDFSVTVTDSRGCFIYKSTFFTGIADELFITQTNIFPNPLQTGELLHVEFNAAESFKGSIEILDNTGRKAAEITGDFTAGKNQSSIAIPALAPGLYLVRIAGNGLHSVKRLMIL